MDGDLDVFLFVYWYIFDHRIWGWDSNFYGYGDMFNMWDMDGFDHRYWDGAFLDVGGDLFVAMASPWFVMSMTVFLMSVTVFLMSEIVLSEIINTTFFLFLVIFNFGFLYFGISHRLFFLLGCC